MREITERLDGASTVLLAAPSMGGDRTLCTSLLTRGGATNVLFVTFTGEPDACVARIENADADVRNTGVVTVGETGPAGDRSGAVTGSVSSPSDLTGLGIEIGTFLSEREPPVTVCFDSLTSMLQYVDFETAYEFLHAVTGQVHAAGARAHFHIDPEAHDEQHVAAITSLFDARVSVGEDVDVRMRDVIE
jgi:hypothetical protein